MTLNKQRHCVVLSDKHKFYFEGSDAYNFYFHDLRKKESFFNRLHIRDAGIVMYSIISYFRACELQYCMSKIDAKPYIGVLENTFQYLEIFFGPLKTYQHDNALIFTARVISHGKLSWLEWPPYSPEQNIIENLWSIRIGKIV